MIRHSGAIDDLMIRTLGLWDGPRVKVLYCRALSIICRGCRCCCCCYAIGRFIIFVTAFRY
ncbi:hypothetical protein TSAR_016631 [Trichomalopsis sarcophagae]|uniref:Uncharacterized protein n=1 Tax=Trichomalopsis sarcophagae TaxID=543379 RepID=A0A232EMS5_9HYME|nr:hypothetical protein TSAR_016631 [Trichomalopsis sarcophagae]